VVIPDLALLDQVVVRAAAQADTIEPVVIGGVRIDVIVAGF
jgi:hypothetical protein